MTQDGISPSPADGSVIEEVQGLCDAASPGPWRLEHDWTSELYDANGSLIGKFIYPHNAKDAAFVIRARTAIPELLSTLAGKEAEIAELKAVLTLEREQGESIRWQTSETVNAQRDQISSLQAPSRV